MECPNNTPNLITYMYSENLVIHDRFPNDTKENTPLNGVFIVIVLLLMSPQYNLFKRKKDYTTY